MDHTPNGARGVRRAERNRLIVHRVRLGLGMILAGMALFAAADLALGDPPAWLVGLNLAGAVLLAGFYALLGHPSVRRRPVPFVLVGAALVCASRGLVGAWQGHLAPTATISVSFALAAGATIPWGVWPQLAVAAMAAAVTALNAAWLPGGLAAVDFHLVAAVATGLTVSVWIALELDRHAVRLFEENLQRRRAEHALSELNAALERAVEGRTAELAATMARLEREAEERIQAARDLRASERRLQDILDNAPAAIHLKDAEGHYLLVNRHWESLSGWTREQVIGRSVRDVTTPEIAAALLENDRTVLAAGRAQQFEERVVVNGEPRTYLSVKFPLAGAGGEPLAVCGISTDITDRIATEAELRRSEAALSALIDNTPDAIWSVDRDERVTVMNAVARARFRERFGTEFDPTRLAPAIPDTLTDEFHALYRRALAGEHVQIERSYPAPSGLTHFLTAAHPIVENGVITGATVFSTDITERKRAEEQVRAHQAELAHVQRLATMGEMAAGLAHEINQPLGAIANYAQGSARRLREATLDAPALLPILEAIAREALRAGEIIRGLRDLVRKDTAPQAAVDLGGLIRDSARFIDAEAHGDGIRIVLDLDPTLPSVVGSAIQIEQVLLNLLLNGVDALRAASNGERCLRVSAAPLDADTVEVAVCDNGVGLPVSPADLFEPFVTTKISGLGLGLSISRSIVEAHGGELRAERNPQGGSTFRFTLPVRGVESAAASHA